MLPIKTPLLVTMLALVPLPVSGAGTDTKTGLVLSPGFELVSAQCTVCHSAKLISQNRADREGWLAMIRWMQETQGLWPLGDNEAQIVDYLAANYGPLGAGRRQPLAPALLPPP